MTRKPTRAEFLDALREYCRGRIVQQHERKKSGKLTKAGNAAVLDFLCGAAAAIEVLGLSDPYGTTGIAFLASVRGGDEFLKPEKTDG